MEKVRRMTQQFSGQHTEVISVLSSINLSYSPAAEVIHMMHEQLIAGQNSTCALVSCFIEAILCVCLVAAPLLLSRMTGKKRICTSHVVCCWFPYTVKKNEW